LTVLSLFIFHTFTFHYSRHCLLGDFILESFKSAIWSSNSLVCFCYSLDCMIIAMLAGQISIPGPSYFLYVPIWSSNFFSFNLVLTSFIFTALEFFFSCVQCVRDHTRFKWQVIFDLFQFIHQTFLFNLFPHVLCFHCSCIGDRAELNDRSISYNPFSDYCKKIKSREQELKLILIKN